MEANELMIGDWVMFPNSIEKVQEISYVCGKGYCASFAASATLFPISIDKIKPIPLTPEMLEKNGFQYNNLPFVQGWEQFGLTLYSGGNGYRINCGTNVALVIDSVHELQHALKLCGINKEIVLLRTTA